MMTAALVLIVIGGLCLYFGYALGFDAGRGQIGPCARGDHMWVNVPPETVADARPRRQCGRCSRREVQVQAGQGVTSEHMWRVEL